MDNSIQFIESPDTVHGRLMEAVHISGYTMARACGELEWLLDEGRWKQCGKGFEKINDFLATMDLSDFKLVIETRKELVKKMADLQASQRAIAKTLGVGQATISRDLEIDSNESSKELKANDNKHIWYENDSNESFPQPPGNIKQGGGKTYNEMDKIAKKEEADQKKTERREKKIEILKKEGEKKDIGQEAYGKFAVIYADPPWRYDFSETKSREIENKYPTMSLDEIKRYRIGSRKQSILEVALEDCVLFLWATNPKLDWAMEIINHWGFIYKTNMVWIKDKIGMGYYARQKHELLLIATKGNPPVPITSDRPESTIMAPRREHSRKPIEFFRAIRKMYPEPLPMLELFRLNRGNEDDNEKNKDKNYESCGYESQNP